jgi:hypothetical protein
MPAADAPGTRRAYPRALTLDSGTAITLRFMTAADGDAVIAFAQSLPAGRFLFLPTTSRFSVVAQWVKNLPPGRSRRWATRWPAMRACTTTRRAGASHVRIQAGSAIDQVRTGLAVGLP